MSILYIPEEEAIKDFASVLAKVDAGDEIVIERPRSPVRVIKSDSDLPRERTAGEMLAILAKRPSQGFMDEDFAADVRKFRESHPESLDGSKWD